MLDVDALRRCEAVGEQLSRKLTARALIQEQVTQAHSTRAELYRTIEGELGPDRRLVAFFTSFRYPVIISDSDADMVEDVLRTTLAKSDELYLMINSPGGDPLAAERIVNVCRNHSAKGKYVVIVPKMAKSAATMISLGARRIVMSNTSELGPIDPQVRVVLEGENEYQYVAAHEVITSYEDLMRKANRTKGELAPYLQQLKRYDSRAIERIRSWQALSDSIAVRALESGMMSGQKAEDIRSRIRQLLDPKYSKAHGRPIYPDVAEQCGLDVEVMTLQSDIWNTIWELYTRLNHLVSDTACKIVESREESYVAPAPRGQQT